MQRSLGLRLLVVVAPAALPLLGSFDADVRVADVRASVSRRPLVVTGVLGECLRAPVDAPLGARFVEPSCPYCAGRRTLGFAAAVGDSVWSAVTGRIHFTGTVAGSNYVTVIPAADSSLLVTVGGLDLELPNEPNRFRPPRAVIEDAWIEAGEVIGVATGPVGLSLRRPSPSGPDAYLDPEPYLARRRVRARLVPLADPGPGDPPRRLATARFGCRRSLIGGADLGPAR